MPLLSLLFLAIGSVLGTCLGIFITRARGAALRARAEELERISGAHEKLTVDLNRRLEAAQSETAQARVALAATQASLSEKDIAHQRELAAWKESEQRLTMAFDSVARRALQGNNEQFLELASAKLQQERSASASQLEQKKEAIGQLLGDTKLQLERLDQHVRSIEGERKDAFARIGEQIHSLVNLQHALGDETRRLSQALNKPMVRGSWGEMQLRRAAELTGMTEYCDFVTQQTIEIDGRKRRPDMVIQMPSGRTVIVDAKVTLEAFIEAANSEDPQRRAECMQNHVRQLRTHIDDLSGRNYFTQFRGSTDLVVAFIPSEALYSAALQTDPHLTEYAASKGVLLATPTTLIALLRAIFYGWKEEKLAQNAQQICELARELHRRIAVVSNHLQKHRRSLNDSVESFNELVGSIERNVITQARKFESLEAASEKPLQDVEVITASPRELQDGKWQPIKLSAIAAAVGEREPN